MQQDIQLQFLYLCALALISPIYTFGIENNPELFIYSWRGGEIGLI